MSVRVYLTIAATVAILYGLAFLVMPVTTSLFFTDFAEARAVFYPRFCGATVLAWGLIVWFARDFQGCYPVRCVLISSIVGLLVNIIITVWATSTESLNAKAWGSAVMLVLLLINAVYQLSIGDRGRVTRHDRTVESRF